MTAPAHEEVRVLVVDDYPAAAETLATLLELDGYTVRIASGGDEALVSVESFKPHCVILDINMPGLDGDNLSALLRTRYGDDIILIAVTGGAGTDRRVADTFARVDHYLLKPVDPAVLRKVLPPVNR